MGGAVSAGEDNDELIDNLVGAEYIKSKDIEAIFRAVDRGDYYETGFKDTAYRDTAWKHGHIHLSAPCIYSEVMEALELKPGQSFLNIGSGTGYLSTMVGLMIGPNGVNHGIEIHPDVVEYAMSKLIQFKDKSSALYKYDFCEPTFIIGNGLDYTDHGQYDRVYVGAAISPEHEQFMCNILKVGGILVAPLGDQLLQIKRINTTEWTKKSILPVSFASLIRPGTRIGVNDADTGQEIKFPDRQPLPLMILTRMAINKLIRTELIKECPELVDATRSKRGKRTSTTTTGVKYKRRRRIAKRLVAFVAASRNGPGGQISSSDTSSDGSGPSRAQQLMEVLGSSSGSDAPIVVAIGGSGTTKGSISGSDTGLGESVTSNSTVGSIGSSVRGSLDGQCASGTSAISVGNEKECSVDEEPLPGPSTSTKPLDVPSPKSGIISPRRPIQVLPHSLSAAISHVIATSSDEEDDDVHDGQGHESSAEEEMETTSDNRTSSESSTTTTEGMDSGEDGSNHGGCIHVEYSSSSEDAEDDPKDGHDDGSKDGGQQLSSPLDEFGYKFMDRIQMLPLPTALKIFLNYDRPFLEYN